MRIQSLADMISDLRSEARLSANVAHGVQLLQPHKQLLRRIQEEVAMSYDWPILNMSDDVVFAAGDRYKTYPDRLDHETIESAWTTDGANIFIPLRYGIGPEQLSQLNSDADQRGTPARHWQHYQSTASETTSQNMFEIWPIPSQDAKVRFYGRRKLTPLVADSDFSTLDGPLIVLHAAAEILAGQKAEDAQLKLQKAQERARLIRLRQAPGGRRRVNMSSSGRGPLPRPGIDYIPG